MTEKEKELIKAYERIDPLVIEDLKKKYDKLSFIKGDTVSDVVFKEGKRYVLVSIMKKRGIKLD